MYEFWGTWKEFGKHNPFSEMFLEIGAILNCECRELLQWRFSGKQF